MASSSALSQNATPTPPEIREDVLVTTDRIEVRIGETPASVVSISSRQIWSAASPVIDDVLRQSVGFSIFRRSNSRNANPTTQGVSLRGVGSSGASRSAVLFDGVPLNDPFGGWVQWGRVNTVAIDTVEILRGGSSSLYGNAGLSGAINIKPRRVQGNRSFSGEIFGGTQSTLSGSFFTGLHAGGWEVDASVSSFHTRGYRPVDEAVRGPLDSFAGVRSNGISGTLRRGLGTAGSIFIRPSYFGEVRTNGTPAQTNRTHIRQVAGGGDAVLIPSRDFKTNWRVFAGRQVFDQVFSAVNASRSAEAITRVQRSPAQTVGLSAQGSFTARDHVVLAGAELRNVRGSSDEIAYANSIGTSLVDSGGRETTTGVFVQDFVRIARRLIVSGRLRYDRWQNYAGLSSTRPLSTNQVSVTSFPDRTEGAWSPHFALLYNLTDQISVYGSASKSFRSPTLNELYRGFRVGNVSTLANNQLTAERAVNLEMGAAYSRKRFSLRASAFRADIDGAIGNITISVTPNLITRERQNAGSTMSKGLEMEGDLRLGRVEVAAGYLYVASTVQDFPNNPAVQGLWIPQVPPHQFTVQIRYSLSSWIFAVQSRGSGMQFDDDLNTFRLESFSQTDVFLSKSLSEDLKIFAGVENIFNSRYSTGRTPIRTVTSPSNLRVGLRWK
jgi:outer membrane receptor protein involved in Fe transport